MSKKHVLSCYEGVYGHAAIQLEQEAPFFTQNA